MENHHYRIRMIGTQIALSLTILSSMGTMAAGIDRSGQSISAFLQNNHYFEAGYSMVDPSVSGVGTNKYAAYRIGDMADSYQYANAALKLQATANISVGLLYDVPFGANGTYSVQDAEFAAGMGMFNEHDESTTATAEAENLSLIIGYQPNKNWNLYAGMAYQTFEADVRVRGAAFSGREALGQYNIHMAKDDAIGWLAGVAFQIPEKMFKASITYRSEIDHELKSHEYGQSNIIGKVSGNADDAFFDVNTLTAITTPKSINLDLQGVIYPSAGVLGFANLRWVDWSSFYIRPEQLHHITKLLGKQGLTPVNPNGSNLISYEDDQISATVGLVKKLNDRWTGNISLGWDSGTGSPSSILGPTKGNWSYGVGVQFSPTKHYFVAGGLKYIQVGDAKAQTASMFGSNQYIAEFKENDGWGYGLKVGYRF